MPDQLLYKTADLSQATVNKALTHLRSLEIVTELTAKQRNRVFAYQALITILNEGTELP